jgi:hypothetical protein
MMDEWWWEFVDRMLSRQRKNLNEHVDWMVQNEKYY